LASKAFEALKKKVEPVEGKLTVKGGKYSVLYGGKRRAISSKYIIPEGKIGRLAGSYPAKVYTAKGRVSAVEIIGHPFIIWCYIPNPELLAAIEANKPEVIAGS
jgi:hypothetical protein